MEDDIDPLTEQKQNYLRQNILERGYDGNTFANFLIQKKGEDGADISNWSLNDLKDVVNEFIALNEQQNNINQENQNEIINQNNENNENKNIAQKENEIEEKKEDIKKEEKVDDWVNVQANKDKNENIPPSTNTNTNTKTNKKADKEISLVGYGIKNIKEINCQTVPNNEITKCENIQIKVGKFEKVEGKLFSKSYISYLITTMPFNWKVKRRFSDFEWLHQILVNTYNYCLIPPIPKKRKNLNKIVSDNFDEAFLRKRSRKFEKFLSYLINDPILKNTKVVYEFLTIEKEEDFQKKKKAYDKKKPSSNLSDFITTDGKAEIEVTKDKEQYVTNIKENANQNEVLLKKINVIIKSLKDDLINASSKLKDLSQNFTKLKNKAIEFTENDDVVQTYEELSSMFQNLSLYISKQNYIIFIYLREYFKYVKNNYRSMKDFLSVGDNLKNNFYKQLKHLKSKKEDLFKKPETIAKWEIDPNDKVDRKTLSGNKSLAMEKMLYKETNNVNNQKQLYGFYLNRIITEYERMKNVNAKRHIKNILRIFERQTDSSTDFITNLADNATALSLSKKDGQKVKKKEKKVKEDEIEENLDLEIKKEDNKTDGSPEQNTGQQ